MLAACFPYAVLLLGVPSCGCGVAGVSFTAFGVYGVALVVAPIVKGICAIFRLFQKAALRQSRNKGLRLPLPTGFKGNVYFVHALQHWPATLPTPDMTAKNVWRAGAPVARLTMITIWPLWRPRPRKP